MPTPPVEFSQNKARSTLALSRYTAQASEEAAGHPNKLNVAGKVKEVADIDKSLWPHEGPKNDILQLHILIKPLPEATRNIEGRVIGVPSQIDPASRQAPRNTGQASLSLSLPNS